MNYEEEFRIFSNNINQAARSFYYHREIQQRAYEDGIKHQEKPGGYFQDSKIFQALNANAQFWDDYKYSSILYTIITLGRIFDSNDKSHGINRLIRLARPSGLFTKEQLRARKISGSENSGEWIETYMTNVSEFRAADYYQFLRYIVETKKLWRTVKAVRDKIYAHQDVINSEKKSGILEKAKYDTFDQIIRRLLTIEHILWEAFHNGKQPDFEFENSSIYKNVKEDTRTLLFRLAGSDETPLN